MQEETKLTLTNAISDVLEKMFFFCPEVLDGPEDAEEPVEQVFVEISTSSENPWRLYLSYSRQLLRNMGANVFEKDEDLVEEAELLDLGKETANMVLGEFINLIGNPGEEKLSLPEVLAAPPPKPGKTQ